MIRGWSGIDWGHPPILADSPNHADMLEAELGRSFVHLLQPTCTSTGSATACAPRPSRSSELKASACVQPPYRKTNGLILIENESLSGGWPQVILDWSSILSNS